GAGGGPAAGYRAFAYSGGLDHLAVMKRDASRDVCVEGLLAPPPMRTGNPPPPGLPPPGGAPGAFPWKGAASCTPKDQPASAHTVSMGAGKIAWTTQLVLPEAVSIDVALAFESSTLGVSEQLVASGIEVEPWP